MAVPNCHYVVLLNVIKRGMPKSEYFIYRNFNLIEIIWGYDNLGL